MAAKRTRSKTPHERLHRRFTPRIHRMVVDPRRLGRDAGDEDQAAGGREVLVGLLGDEELAARVNGEDAVVVGGGDLVDFAEVFEACHTPSNRQSNTLAA